MRRVVTRAGVPAHAMLAVALLCACSASEQRSADSATPDYFVADSTQSNADSPRVSGRPSTTRPAQAQPASHAPDTLVGQVAEMGADPATWLALVPHGGRAMRLDGNIDPLRRVIGAEVWISGFTNGGFNVEQFEVRSVDSRPVDDGIVFVSSHGVSIRMRSGAMRGVPNAPPALSEMRGARIWISRPVANQAPSYGLLAAAPR